MNHCSRETIASESRAQDSQRGEARMELGSESDS